MALVRPHVAFPDQFPPQYLQAGCDYTEKRQIPIDEDNWKTITDAMADVVRPIGTAPSAHLNGHRLRRQDRHRADDFQRR